MDFPTFRKLGQDEFGKKAFDHQNFEILMQSK